MIINNHLLILENVIRASYPDYKFSVWTKEQGKEPTHYMVREEGEPIIVISNELPIYIACRQIVEMFLSIIITVYKVEGSTDAHYRVISSRFNDRLTKMEEEMSSVLEEGIKVYNKKEAVLH